MKCEACGKDGTLDIRATLIRCSFCDGEWGRVNGFWVESKPPRCMECGGDGKTAQDYAWDDSQYSRPDTHEEGSPDQDPSNGDGFDRDF